MTGAEAGTAASCAAPEAEVIDVNVPQVGFGSDRAGFHAHLNGYS
jgi:hypothetical protein